MDATAAFIGVGYACTDTLALWMPPDANQPDGCWRSFGGREFEPGSKLGRAHTYLGPVAAWNRRTPPPLPTREEVEATMRRHMRLKWTGHDHADFDARSITKAADAVLRLLGGENADG